MGDYIDIKRLYIVIRVYSLCAARECLESQCVSEYILYKEEVQETIQTPTCILLIQPLFRIFEEKHSQTSILTIL